MSSPFQIQIPKRSKVCMAGQELLSPGMEYFSLLVENLENGYERQDYCAHCWKQNILKDEQKLLSKHWKSKVPNKKDAPIIPKSRDEQILCLLKSSLENNHPDSQNESFVLALYLARKRFMLLRKEVIQQDQSVMQLYEIPDREEMIWVKKIELSNLQIEAIQLEIAKKLKAYGN